MKLLIVDQFSGVTPYWVQQQKISFDDLVRFCLSTNIGGYKLPEVREMSPTELADWKPSRGSTVFCADEHGMAVVHRLRWDSN